MGRPLRIEFPGAVYHVTSRGNARQSVFIGEDDRRAFLNILHKVVMRHAWILHAYCLMGNHYHLLVETPRPNLSAGMRTVNGQYTTAFNRQRRRVGHLFQSRFASVLVHKESHLLELCRYIVLNPVRARGMRIRRPEEWHWSSYRATAGFEPPPTFLDITWILSRFAKARKPAQLLYKEFVREGIGLGTPLAGARGGLVLGPESFADEVLGLLGDRPLSHEHPRMQRLSVRPPLGKLIPKGSCSSGVKRDLAAAEAHILHGYTQKAIADHLGLHYATVCRIIQRIEAERGEEDDG